VSLNAEKIAKKFTVRLFGDRLTDDFIHQFTQKRYDVEAKLEDFILEIEKTVQEDIARYLRASRDSYVEKSGIDLASDISEGKYYGAEVFTGADG
jgi:hypothetical protein